MTELRVTRHAREGHLYHVRTASMVWSTDIVIAPPR
jgi:hypothetical protein